MVGQVKSHDTRENLLASATEVFVKKGFSGARVDEIARRAKANKAMIYYHFGSKEGLYKAVLLKYIGGLHEEIARVPRVPTRWPGFSPSTPLSGTRSKAVRRFPS